jgi:hypothetical protein
LISEKAEITLYTRNNPVGHGLSASGNLLTTGLNYRYTICHTTEDSVTVDSIGAFYFHFKLADVGPVYEYYCGRDTLRGRVDVYNETASERQYVLSGFFCGKFSAMLRVVDLPDADNLKAALVYYYNAKEDPDTTFVQYVLMTPN